MTHRFDDNVHSQMVVIDFFEDRDVTPVGTVDDQQWIPYRRKRCLHMFLVHLQLCACLVEHANHGLGKQEQIKYIGQIQQNF